MTRTKQAGAKEGRRMQTGEAGRESCRYASEALNSQTNTRQMPPKSTELDGRMLLVLSQASKERGSPVLQRGGVDAVTISARTPSTPMRSQRPSRHAEAFLGVHER